jgi:hypothetical protein
VDDPIPADHGSGAAARRREPRGSGCPAAASAPRESASDADVGRAAEPDSDVDDETHGSDTGPAAGLASDTTGEAHEPGSADERPIADHGSGVEVGVDEAGGSDRAGGAVPPLAAEIDSGRDVAGAVLAYKRAPVVAGPLGVEAVDAEVAGVEAMGAGSGCHVSGSSDLWLP